MNRGATSSTSIDRIPQTGQQESVPWCQREAGRKSFYAARTEWAARLGLEPTDGLYLGELFEGPRTIQEIATSLDGCGPAPSDVRKGVERLVRLRMMAPIAPPPAPPLRPPLPTSPAPELASPRPLDLPRRFGHKGGCSSGFSFAVGCCPRQAAASHTKGLMNTYPQ